MHDQPNSRPAVSTAALWLAVARAVCELGYARLRLGSRQPGDFAPEAESPSGPICRENRMLAERLAYIIPRIARRLPWRADCLVQAMAARRWLAAKAVPTRLHIGSRKTPERGFEAHAWLTVGDLVVTGWDIADFHQFAEFRAPKGA